MGRWLGGLTWTLSSAEGVCGSSPTASPLGLLSPSFIFLDWRLSECLSSSAAKAAACLRPGQRLRAIKDNKRKRFVKCGKGTASGTEESRTVQEVPRNKRGSGATLSRSCKQDDTRERAHHTLGAFSRSCQASAASHPLGRLPAFELGS